MAFISQGMYLVFQGSQINEVSNVQLHPELLSKHQAYVKEKTNSKSDKPVFFVFHGGSGSTKQDYSDAIKYGIGLPELIYLGALTSFVGVVKVNMDTGEKFWWNMGRSCRASLTYLF